MLREDPEVPPVLVEWQKNDRVRVEVTRGKFIGTGGPGNLEEILGLFFEKVV